MGERKWKYLVAWPRWPPWPYMVKTLQKSSSPEPPGRLPWNLVFSILGSGPSKFVQMMTRGWSWPNLFRSQIWSIGLFNGKKWKMWIFFKLLQCVSSKLVMQLTKWVNGLTRVLKVKVIQISKFKLVFLRNLWVIWNQISYESSWEKEMKIYSKRFGHMTKMAAITIYDKNSSKIFFSRITRPFALKLGM